MTFWVIFIVRSSAVVEKVRDASYYVDMLLHMNGEVFVCLRT